MIVYRDIITGDEMLSDAFPLKQVVDSEGNPVRYGFDLSRLSSIRLVILGLLCFTGRRFDVLRVQEHRQER